MEKLISFIKKNWESIRYRPTRLNDKLFYIEMPKKKWGFIPVILWIEIKNKNMVKIADEVIEDKEFYKTLLKVKLSYMEKKENKTVKKYLRYL